MEVIFPLKRIYDLIGTPSHQTHLCAVNHPDITRHIWCLQPVCVAKAQDRSGAIVRASADNGDNAQQQPRSAALQPPALVSNRRQLMVFTGVSVAAAAAAGLSTTSTVHAGEGELERLFVSTLRFWVTLFCGCL
jgi:hypothetical protein